MPNTFHVGKPDVGKVISVDDVATMDQWGAALADQIDAIQDTNKFYRENQQGMGKKPGYVDYGRSEMAVPVKLMLAYEKAHPDWDFRDDKQFYRFLDAHPEFDRRPKREATRRG